MIFNKATLKVAARAMLSIAIVLSFFPALDNFVEESAYAEETTQEKLDAAQSQLDSVNAELEQLQSENVALQNELANTVRKIDDEQSKLEEKQVQLNKRVASKYKNGDTGMIDVVLSASNFAEFANNWFFANKVIQSEADLVEDIKRVKGELEDLKAFQQEQIKAVQQKTNEVTELVNSLSDEVKQLIEQRDAELAAAAAAAEAARQQQEAAAAAAAAGASSFYSGGQTFSYTGSLSNASASEKGKAIVAACYITPSPGQGWCAAWVSNVYRNAGVGWFGGNACDMYWNYCTSSDKSTLEVGMIVADPSHSGTGSAGEIYGHVGIYIGGGMVISNVGAIYTQTLDSFISFYGNRYPVKWGWPR